MDRSRSRSWTKRPKNRTGLDFQALAGRSRLLDLKNRSMRLGVVESCELHSHHQNGEVLRGKTAKREMEQVNAIGGIILTRNPLSCRNPRIFLCRREISPLSAKEGCLCKFVQS